MSRRAARRPEGTESSPSAMRMNGAAISTTPSRIAGRGLRRMSPSAARALPPSTSTIARSPTAPIAAWKKATSTAEKSCSAYLMSMNTAPQSADMRTSWPIWRSVIAAHPAGSIPSFLLASLAPAHPLSACLSLSDRAPFSRKRRRPSPRCCRSLASRLFAKRHATGACLALAAPRYHYFEEGQRTRLIEEAAVAPMPWWGSGRTGFGRLALWVHHVCA